MLSLSRITEGKVIPERAVFLPDPDCSVTKETDVDMSVLGVWAKAFEDQ